MDENAVSAVHISNSLLGYFDEGDTGCFGCRNGMLKLKS